MLTETQTPALLSGQLSQHTVHTIPATVTGRAGEGVLLAVKQHVPYTISHWQTDQANNVIWLTLKSAQSSQLPLALGVCYIPPQSSMSPQLKRRSAQLRFGSLAAHLADASARGHVFLAGDFNGRVGSCSQAWVSELSPDIPVQLQNTDSTVNSHGGKLLQMCEDTAMVLCTGRTPSDVPAQPSFKARSNTQPSRLDHVLVDAELFHAIQSYGVGPVMAESDHLPLELRLSLAAPAMLQCAAMRLQLRQAKRLSPLSPTVQLLGRQYQTQLRYSRAQYNQQQIADLRQLLKSNPRKFWQQTHLPHMLLPLELQHPAAWDAFIAQLTAPPSQYASNLPPPHTSQPLPADSLNQPLTLTEVETALRSLHNGRSAAMLGYTSELLRYAQLSATPEMPVPPHLLAPCLLVLCNAAFSTGRVPLSWKSSLVTPIYKKGDATDTANYRPIAVGEPSGRLYASILASRLVEYTKEQQLRSPTQAGHRPQLGTMH